MKLPNRALSDVDLMKYAKKLKIPHFRGVFMRDALPSSPPRQCESAIINLDTQKGPGTHWVAYNKNKDSVLYFDSFGLLKPPIELVRYLEGGSKCTIKYNPDTYQQYNTINCGHLCLEFLYKNSKHV